MNVSDNNQTSTDSAALAKDIRDVPSPGQLLRKKREDDGLELAAIARSLNLDPWILKALEADDFSGLGAQVFAKGHLKKYASHLKLNPEDVLFAYYQVADRKDTAPVITQYLSVDKQRKSHAWLLKSFVWLLGVLAVCVLLYAAYRVAMWWLQDAEQSTGTVTELSLSQTNAGNSTAQANTQINPYVNTVPVKTPDLEESVDDAEAETIVTQTSDSNQDAANVVPLPAESADNGDVQNLNGSADESNTNSPNTNNSVASATVASSSLEDGQKVLRLNFTEDSWVEISNTNGKRLIYGMAKRGTVRELVLDGVTEVFLGNALGTKLSLNGQTYDIPVDAKAGRTARFMLSPSGS